MDPIDHFVADVEASGEDKKHEAPPEFEFWWADHCPNATQAEALSEWCLLHAPYQPIYTQAQRDAYAAEAVKQERERLRERWAGFAEEYRGDAVEALWIANAIRKDQP